jgi:hypothetical protein
MPRRPAGIGGLAKAVHNKPQDAWSRYLVWMRGAWQGDVAQVLEELQT